MYRNILVPVDFTDRNREAVRVAAEFAAQSEGQVSLLHVVQTIPLAGKVGMQGFYDELLEASHAQLAELGELLDDLGVAWGSQSIIGSRVAEIVGAATTNAIDLVVLSSHPVQLGGDAAADGWATLSYQVAVLAPCPVLLVK